MSRAGINADKIVRMAAKITDEKGFDAVTLKEVGERLGIRSPSLYTHINGLPALREKVSVQAMGMLRERLVRATMGKGGVEALREMGRAYIQFAREHTGLYETIQWMNIAADVQSGSLFSDVVQLVYDICAGIGTSELEASHLIRTVRSLTHGFASVESHNGFSHPSSVESSFDYAIDTLLLGVEARHKGGIRAAESDSTIRPV